MSRKNFNRYRQRTSFPTSIFTRSSQGGRAERARRWCTRWQLELVTSTRSLARPAVDRDGFSILPSSMLVVARSGNRQPTPSPKASFTELSHGARLERARRWWTRWQLAPATSTRSLARLAVEGG